MNSIERYIINSVEVNNNKNPLIYTSKELKWGRVENYLAGLMKRFKDFEVQKKKSQKEPMQWGRKEVKPLLFEVNAPIQHLTNILKEENIPKKVEEKTNEAIASLIGVVASQRLLYSKDELVTTHQSLTQLLQH